MAWLIFTVDHNIHYDPTAVYHASHSERLHCCEPEYEWTALKSLTHHHKTPHTFYLCQMAHDEHA